MRGTDGILGQRAGVALVYRIPAISGTGPATAVLQDGQRVEVDGNPGVVRPFRAT